MFTEFSQGMILPAKDSASDLTKLDSDKSNKVCVKNSNIVTHELRIH